MQGCIKRMLRRGASADVVAIGHRGAERSLRRMKADRKRVFVLSPNMAPRATNSWLPRPPYPPPSPRRLIAIVVARHDEVNGRVNLTGTVHQAVFGRRITLQQ